LPKSVRSTATGHSAWLKGRLIFKTNAGLRDRELALPSRPDCLRLAKLGDIHVTANYNWRTPQRLRSLADIAGARTISLSPYLDRPKILILALSFSDTNDHEVLHHPKK